MNVGNFTLGRLTSSLGNVENMVLQIHELKSTASDRRGSSPDIELSKQGVEFSLVIATTPRGIDFLDRIEAGEGHFIRT